MRFAQVMLLGALTAGVQAIFLREASSDHFDFFPWLYNYKLLGLAAGVSWGRRMFRIPVQVWLGGRRSAWPGGCSCGKRRRQSSRGSNISWIHSGLSTGVGYFVLAKSLFNQHFCSTRHYNQTTTYIVHKIHLPFRICKTIRSCNVSLLYFFSGIHNRLPGGVDKSRVQDLRQPPSRRGLQLRSKL